MKPIRFFSFLAIACGLLGVSPLWAQQQEYPEVEIARGGQFFRANCAGCHGPDGNLVEGVSLADPRFLQGESDRELIEIIVNGIPGTAMPESNYSDLQAGNIVAYLRSLSLDSRPVSGDPARGRPLFEVGGCRNCHRVNGNGSRVGPDLSDIGLVRRSAELEESILEPNATVLPENRFIRVVTPDGMTLTGRLLNHDSVTVQFLDSEEQLRSFMKSDLNQFAFVEESPMPSFRTRFNADELEDLLSYLVSLKGETTP